MNHTHLRNYKININSHATVDAAIISISPIKDDSSFLDGEQTDSERQDIGDKGQQDTLKKFKARV